MAALAEGRQDLSLASFTEREVDWAVATGLGPILHHVTQDDSERDRCSTWNTVLSADLTARVISSGQHAAMLEILEHCRDVAPITLLKGISFADRLYPEPHQRILRDLDFLVPRADYPAVEQILLRLGYQQEETHRRRFYEESHHHAPPFRHPGTGNWVEVHWGLVPLDEPQAGEPAFGLETITAESVELDFQGLRTRRLGNELELLHLASHWGTGEKIVGGMVVLFDATLVLTRSPAIDWSKIGCWLGETASAIDFLFLASYLEDRALVAVPHGVVDKDRLRRAKVGSAGVALLHRLIDRHIVDGRDPRWPMTEAAFGRLWRELLRPGPAWRNYLRLARYLLPAPLRGKRPMPRQ